MPTPPAPSFPTPALTSRTLRHSYHIGRGEQGVLTFEPYKSILLPHWRFRTPAIALQSSGTLARAFHSYVAEGDFVGADMARKFLQMGMTRAKRYADRKGGRKYVKGEGASEEKVLLPKSQTHADHREKLAASAIFREVWLECKEDDEYARLKAAWQREVKEGQRMEETKGKDDAAGEGHGEAHDDDDGRHRHTEHQSAQRRSARNRQRLNKGT